MSFETNFKRFSKLAISQAFLYRFGSKLVCDQGLAMRWLMPNGSQIGAGMAKISGGERDVHDLNFTFIAL